MTKPDLGPPVQEVTARIEKVWDYCNEETRQLINDLFGYWEAVSTDLCVMDLRLKKQWTAGSNLYVEKDLTEAYNQGYKDGQNNFYGQNLSMEERQVPACPKCGKK